MEKIRKMGKISKKCFVLLFAVTIVLSQLSYVFAITAGEINVIVEKDIYVNLKEVKTITFKEVLKKGDTNFAYSITGNEANYLTETLEDAYNDNRVKVNSTDWSNFQKATSVGAHKLRFVYTNKALADAGKVAESVQNNEVYVHIVKDGITSYHPSTDDTALAAIHIHNFGFPLANAKTFTKDSAKTVADSEFNIWDTANTPLNQNGFVLSPGKDLSAKAVYKDADIKKINSATKSGAYPVNVAVTHYENKTVSRDYTVFLTNKNTIIDKSKDLAVFADDYVITKEDAAKATKENVIKDGNLVSYNYVSGKAVAGKFDFSVAQLNKSEGDTTVTIPFSFTDNSGKQVTSKVNVKVVAKTIEPKPPVNPVSPGTGDNTNIIVYTIALLGSVLLAVVAVVIVKKKNKFAKKTSK